MSSGCLRIADFFSCYLRRFNIFTSAIIIIIIIIKKSKTDDTTKLPFNFFKLVYSQHIFKSIVREKNTLAFLRGIDVSLKKCQATLSAILYIT